MHSRNHPLLPPSIRLAAAGFLWPNGVSLDASRNLFVRNLPKLKRTRSSFWIDWHNPRDRIKPWYVAVNASLAQHN